jgi:hypothetical protein
VHDPEQASRRQAEPIPAKGSRAREEYGLTGVIRKTQAGKGTSLHVVETKDEVAAGWLLTEAPPAAGLMWQRVAPVAGEAPNPVAWIFMSTAGLFRALAVTGLWVVALSVSTRTRAGVGLVVVLAVTGAGMIVHHLNP